VESSPAGGALGLRPEAAAIARAIAAANVIHLASHENPDGDAVGSLLGLRLILLELGKTVHVALPHPVPGRYAFLQGANAVELSLPADAPDLAIALDCDGADRLADLRDAILAAPVVANVDHHQGNHSFGDLRYVDPSAPATAAQVHAIAGELGVAISASEATCLYCGLATDTGGFRFGNTTAAALRVGAELVEAGADPEDIARRVFTQRPLAAALLEGRALCSLRPVLGGRVLVASLSRDDFRSAAAGPDDTEGIIDAFRDVRGVEVAVLLKESEPRTWQVSLRAQDVDVEAVAAQFGGGGHRVAAGCTVNGNLEEVEVGVLAAVEGALREGEAGA